MASEIKTWAEYQYHVLKKIEELMDEQDRIDAAIEKVKDDCILKLEQLSERMSEKLTDHEKQIAILQLRAGIWGFAAGALPIIAWLVAEYIRNSK